MWDHCLGKVAKLLIIGSSQILEWNSAKSQPSIVNSPIAAGVAHSVWTISVDLERTQVYSK